MKTSQKFNAIRIGLVALVLPMLISACATEAQFLAQTQPAAVNTALARGRFELNCPQATGTVLSKKMTYINGVGIGMGGGTGYEWVNIRWVLKAVISRQFMKPCAVILIIVMRSQGTVAL